MDIQITKVNEDQKEILRNLLEKYDYEFSQYDQRDVNMLGLYGYSHLDCYWTEENRFAFFIMVDGNLAGFVMVNGHSETPQKTDYSMAEFFIMYKYRRHGIGKYAVTQIFNQIHGEWELKYHPKNIASAYFWNNVISEYTNGDFQLTKAYPNTEYDDGTLADFFFFKT